MAVPRTMLGTRFLSRGRILPDLQGLSYLSRVNVAENNVHARFSLALARLAAARILEDPSRIATAAALLERWRRQRGGLTQARAEWERVIQTEQPEHVAALLVEETDEGQRRRASHPFIQPPFFTEEERIALFASAHAN